MRWPIALAAAWLAFASPCAAQMTTLGAGSSPKVVSSGGSYTGPGDVQSGATAWHGLRAFSAATAGTKSINIVRASDSTTTDISTLANGNLDVATATTFCAATTCKVVTIYDKVGTADLTQATDANRPAFTLNCIGSLPCMTFSGPLGAMRLCTSGNGPAVATPWSVEVVAKRTGSNTTLQGLYGGFDGSSADAIYFSGTASTIQLTVPGAVSLSGATDNNWFAMQGVASSGANAVFANATLSNTGATGIPTAWVNTNKVCMGNDVFASNALVGTITEGGVWAALAFTPTQANALASNAKTYWGF